MLPSNFKDDLKERKKLNVYLKNAEKYLDAFNKGDGGEKLLSLENMRVKVSKFPATLK